MHNYKTPHFSELSKNKDATIYTVGGYFDAMSLAKEMKEVNEFDIFRGHASWDYKPDPTLARKVLEKGNDYLIGDEYQELIGYFSQFLTNHPAGQYLKYDDDAFFAIAQHYGLPTTYLDFTTDPEVAGFFAIYKRPPELKNDLCTILCANRSNFKEKIRKFEPLFEQKPDRLPRIVEIDVTNLWRLQLQKGLFIQIPLLRYDNKPKIESFEDHFFSFDRIYFIHSEKAASALSLDRVYPKDKSLLEEVIDQYFDNVRRKEWIEAVRKKKEEGKLNVVIFDEIYQPADTIFLEDPGIDRSWENESLELNLNDLCEHWEEMNTGELLVINIDCNAARSKLEKVIFDQVYAKLISLNNDIKYLIRFEIEVVNCAKPDLFKKELSHCLSRIWNGMRLRPYSNQEIAQSLTNYLLLEHAAYIHYVIEKMSGDESFFYKQPVKLCLAGPNSAETRAYVGLADLLQAIRDDFTAFLQQMYRESFEQGDLSAIFVNQNNPRYIFNFERLRKLFIEQIIPGQIYRRGIEEKFPIFFSPTQISVLLPI